MRRAILVVPKMPSVCQGCGCQCSSCGGGTSFDLDFAHRHEELQAAVREREERLGRAEQALVVNQNRHEDDTARLNDEMAKLRDRYDRLFDSHKKLQKLNASLEDKILDLVSKTEKEKFQLEGQVAQLRTRLADAQTTVSQLEQDAEDYRADCAVAVHMLQCKPSEFVSHKLSSFPINIQERVREMMPSQEKPPLSESPEEERKMHVPISTFPPTAMVYTVRKQNTEARSAQKTDRGSVPQGVLSQVLSRKLGQRRTRWTYVCGECRKDSVMIDRGCQTDGAVASPGLSPRVTYDLDTFVA